MMPPATCAREWWCITMLMEAVVLLSGGPPTRSGQGHGDAPRDLCAGVVVHHHVDGGCIVVELRTTTPHPQWAGAW